MAVRIKKTKMAAPQSLQSKPQSFDEDPADSLACRALRIVFVACDGLYVKDIHQAASVCRGMRSDPEVHHHLSLMVHGRKRRTLLMYAAKTGDVERIRFLIKAAAGLPKRAALLTFCNDPHKIAKTVSAAAHAIVWRKDEALREIMEAFREVRLKAAFAIEKIKVGLALDWIAQNNHTAKLTRQIAAYDERRAKDICDIMRAFKDHIDFGDFGRIRISGAPYVSIELKKLEAELAELADERLGADD